jgi:hypothetical protein
MKGLLGLFSLKTVALVMSAFVGWQAVIFFRARPPAYTEAEQQAVDAACQNFASQLAGKLTNATTRVGIAHLFSDARDGATLALRAAVGRLSGCRIEEQSIIQKFLADISRAIAEATSLDEIFTAGRKVELDVVIAGRVVAVTAAPEGGASATLALYAYDVRQGGWLVKDSFTARWQPGVMDRIRALPLWLRLGLWALLAGLLPWLTAFATRWALEQKQNCASVIIIAAYTMADIALAFVLGIIRLGHGWLAPALVVLLAAVWNWRACERLAKREGAY